MRLPTGEMMLLPLSSKFASEAFVSEANVDWGSESLLYKLISPGGVFFDVGANIGYYSLYMLPKVSRVYAFEPDPRMRTKLELVLEGRKSIHVISYAVGQSDGKAMFTLESTGEVSHFADSRTGLQSSNIEVQVVSIDSFVATHHVEKVDAIKIDVEGYDYFVVEGSLAVMRSHRPVVLTEAKPEPRLFALTDLVRYVICAYVRSQSDNTLSFRKVSQEEGLLVQTKMLFLTPRERLAEILSLS